MTIAPTSLRGRITLAAVGIVGVVLAVAATLIFVVQRGQLLQGIDNSLDREVGEAAAALNGSPSSTVGDRGEERFVQVIGPDGTIIGGSSAVLRTTLVVDLLTLDLDEDGLQFLSAENLPIEDDEYRVLVRQVEIRGEDSLVVVGENTDDLRDSLRVLGISLAVVVPLATALLGAVAWLLVNRTLAPVSAIQREVGRIGGERRGERVPVPDTQDEIADLAATMNEMLDRIDHAYERQQNFVADASHELRSPITRLRTSLEVDLAAADRDLNATGFDLLDDVAELQTLVEDLLFLARAGHHPVAEQRRVDLDAIVDRVVAQLGPGSRVPIVTRGVEPVEAWGNEGHLSRLVTNLVTNAVRHAATQVWITLAVVDDRVLLEVHDDGSGVPAADRARVFERFTRLDESRTSATGGAGLGLAIAGEITHAHSGTIDVVQSSHGGALFRVSLPPSH